MMVIRPQGRQTQPNRPYKPYIHRSRGSVIEVFPVMTDVRKLKAKVI